jgi:hypothetical protein
MKGRFLIVALAAAGILLSAHSSFAQARGGARGGGQPADTRPAPRWPDGHVNLGPVPGSEMGLWEATPTSIPLARADAASDFGLFAADMSEPTDSFLAAKPKLSQIPFQPWARSLFAARVMTRQEPYTRCKPSSGARQVATAYGTQFVEVPELQFSISSKRVVPTASEPSTWTAAPIQLRSLPAVAVTPSDVGKAIL